MSIVKKKILILSAVFLCACILGMLKAPEGQAEERVGSAMDAASLPVLCAELGEQLINPLYGYSGKMDAGTLGLSMYPFTEDLSMKVHLLDGSETPGAVLYEVRSEDGSRLIEKGTVTHFGGSRADRYFSFSLQDLYEPETYYRLQFEVTLTSRKAYYYTRIIKTDGDNLEPLVSYASSMHGNLYNRSDANYYAAKLEPDNLSDKDTLAYVNINCSMDQVAWGDSGAKQVSDTYMTIEAIQGGYGYFHFDCLVQADVGEGSPETFRVTEHMTLQRNRNAMYLLRYERHTQQLWEIDENAIVPAGLLLGMQEEQDIQVVGDKDGDLTAFTVAGELYTYDTEKQHLTRVFSFRNGGEHALRSIMKDYRIKILETDKDGNLEFVVYGYMNGGNREGMCGLVYYSYDAEEAILNEKMYVASARAYEMVKQDAETLFLKGNDHFLYFCFDDQIIAMDLASGEAAVLVTRTEMPSLVMNDSGTAFAWQNGGKETAHSVRVMNLTAGTNLIVEAPEGEFIRTLGYIREDLIVGYGAEDGTPIFDGENERLPMDRLEILGPELDVLLDYHYDNIFLVDIAGDAEKITLHRYAKAAGLYQYLNDDVLLRSDSAAKTPASPVSRYTHKTLKRMFVIPIGKLPSYLRMEVTASKGVLPGRVLTLPDTGTADVPPVRYLAFGKGRMLGEMTTPGAAIALAAADYGYALSSEGRLIWAWSAKKEETELPVGAIRTDLAEALDISGASFRTLSFFLDRDMPVKWTSPELGIRWIIGYEWQNAILYDPGKREVYRMGQDELAAKIERNSNYLWCYTN